MRIVQEVTEYRDPSPQRTSMIELEVVSDKGREKHDESETGTGEGEFIEARVVRLAFSSYSDSFVS
jgi:hypothetical protein